MFKTKYVRVGKTLYALPASVQKNYFTHFGLEPEPLTSDHLEHLRQGLEGFLADKPNRDMNFTISNGIIRDIRIYTRPTENRQAYEKYLLSDDEPTEPLPADEDPEEPLSTEEDSEIPSIVDVLEE
ncbi:hypothetical protein HYU22_02155 [Candidatus Woesearchaeota archaeon]|nr:hypothetical protein [Candidatus Woesearchaeota archaeon]